MTDTILITGASGFTGARLLDRLRKDGRAAFGLTRRPQRPTDVAGDLADRASLDALLRQVRPATIVHLAGITFAQHGDVAEVYDANVVGTANLLGAVAALEGSPAHVIVSSSATVYQPRDDGAAIEEDQTQTPINHYGASKMAVEHVARLFGDKLPITVTRPFNYTGPGQTSKFLVPKIVDHFARGARRIELGNLDLYRDFSSLETIVGVYERLIARPAPGRTFNLCSGRSIFLRDVIGWMEAIAGYRIEVETNPAFVRAGEPLRFIGSKARLEAHLGPVAEQRFEETLTAMYQACTNQL
jgi:nucleoside-diphosphate-sugar epimerase